MQSEWPGRCDDILLCYIYVNSIIFGTGKMLSVIHNSLEVTRWTRDRHPLPSPKELRSHKDESMGKADTSYPSYNSLIKWDSNRSLSIKRPQRPKLGSNPRITR